MGGLLFQAFIYLCAAVIAVPIAKRLGLGSVLGYLLAGIFIGPVIGLVGSETQTIQHFAEFGVVMMLFLVGLELQPRMLWEMRNRLIGLGGLQVALTTALITAAALMMGLYWSVALTVGLIFSLSSTAIVLQTLNEKGLSKTEGGRAGFSVLLFQDIAVIPMLALIPLLALPELVGDGGGTLAAAADSHGDAGHHHGMSLVAGLPGWAHALVVLGAIASVLLGGHFLSRPM
ncbi:MAG: cation:proton antiporter, partial [Candidatus Thiodiazotropha taylori]